MQALLTAIKAKHEKVLPAAKEVNPGEQKLDRKKKEVTALPTATKVKDEKVLPAAKEVNPGEQKLDRKKNEVTALPAAAEVKDEKALPVAKEVNPDEKKQSSQSTSDGVMPAQPEQMSNKATGCEAESKVHDQGSTHKNNDQKGDDSTAGELGGMIDGLPTPPEPLDLEPSACSWRGPVNHAGRDMELVEQEKIMFPAFIATGLHGPIQHNTIYCAVPFPKWPMTAQGGNYARMIGQSVWGKDPKAIPPVYVPRERPLPPPPLPPPPVTPPPAVVHPAQGNWYEPTDWSYWPWGNDGMDWDYWSNESWQQYGCNEQEAGQEQFQHGPGEQHEEQGHLCQVQGGEGDVQEFANVSGTKGASSDEMEEIPVEPSATAGSIAPKAMPTRSMRPKEPSMPPPAHLYAGAYNQLMQTLGLKKSS